MTAKQTKSATKRKARKMVKAWAFTSLFGVKLCNDRSAARKLRAVYVDEMGTACGPIVAISVPAPAPVKKGKK